MSNKINALEETLAEESAIVPATFSLPSKLPAVEQAARLKFAQIVYKRSRGNRSQEGHFDYETNKWMPTQREDLGAAEPRARAPSHFKRWYHVYALCMRALDGHDVPPDIAKARDELWPTLHERHYVEAVDAAQKAASDRHEKQQRQAEKRARLLAEAQVKESREGRIKAAEARVAAYEATIAKHMAKVRALETRKKRALRSIAALKRIGEKAKT